MSKLTGEKSYSWKPSITDEERQLGRLIPGYTEWRKQVYKRDNYTCQICDKRGDKLVSHHLNDYSTYKDLRTELTNGVTLCKACHDAFHKWNGGRDKSCTKDDFIRFKEDMNER